MKATTIFLGLSASLFDFAAAALADGLMTPALPVRRGTDRLECTAVNISAVNQSIALSMSDRNGDGIIVDCIGGDIAPGQSCSARFAANLIGQGLSPFTCRIDAVPGPSNTGAVLGLLCVKFGDPAGGETCIKAENIP